MSGTLERTDRLPRTGRRRTRARVLGTVQGVGFRPYAFRLATELELGGWILNDERGCCSRSRDHRRPSTGSSLACRPKRHRSRRSRRSTPSPCPRRARAASGSSNPIGAGSRGARRPDTATCGECLAELRDPADRRYRYPFTNCTNCGPRLTIVTGVPYDRPLTTMAGFRMCGMSRRVREPARPPLPCPAQRLPRLRPAGATRRRPRRDAGRPGLGPRRRRDGRAHAARRKHPRDQGARRLPLGVRGRGPARGDGAPTRKHREDRPFALMAPDLAAARELVELGLARRRCSQGRRRPIVIARRRAGAPVAAGVAPVRRSRSDAALLAASSPAAGGHRRDARDDLGQRLR